MLPADIWVLTSLTTESTVADDVGLAVCGVYVSLEAALYDLASGQLGAEVAASIEWHWLRPTAGIGVLRTQGEHTSFHLERHALHSAVYEGSREVSL